MFRLSTQSPVVRRIANKLRQQRRRQRQASGIMINKTINALDCVQLRGAKY